jgi:adenylate cyclase
VLKTSRAQRKHATVMNADVAGYSRMMAADDVLTLQSLLECFETVCDLIREYGGRVVDAPGDNLMAEFGDERLALDCAVQVQRRLRDRSAGCDKDERMQLRIGLHSGELLAHRGRLYGDVVNLAARLQAAATPEGIMLSESVASRVDATLARTLHDLGLTRFKNIPYRVRTLEVPVPD